MITANSPTITLAFSCIGSNLDNLIGMLDNLTVHDHIEFLIVVQRAVDDNKYSYCDHIKIIFSDTVGLSKSRNIAISHASKDYIWFLDDDVIIENQYIVQLLNEIQCNALVDFFRVKIGCIENSGEFYKTYTKLDPVRKFHLLKFSSIEIVCRRKFVQQHQIGFNERLGLGTPLQATEEANFLIDAWDKGAQFKMIEQMLVKHTCIFDDRVLANNNIMLARGAIASRFGLIGFVLLAHWSLRYVVKYKKLSYLSNLLRGYFVGYRGLNRMLDRASSK